MLKRRNHHHRIAWAMLVTTAALLAGGSAVLAQDNPLGEDMEFTDVRAQTHEFIGYNKSIRLTAAQDAIKKKALGSLRAPCCDDNSAYTCCCECNLRRTTWGLANYLIAEQGYSAAQVTQKVAEWFKFVNPGGFSGDACYKGGCMRALSDNGCGGMNETHLVF